VIVGAGFAGLNAARALMNQPVDILMIDRNNYHTFTPLLYQVATCGLDPSDIAYPVRGIVRNAKNIRFRVGRVSAIDTAERTISIEENGQTHLEAYDTLILATGTVTHYFGNTTIQQIGFDLKGLSGAVRLRNHILSLLERAAWTDNMAERRALTTLVVVGGGPTGLETAGALYELYNDVVKSEYPHVAELAAQVILLEATDRVLAPYPEKLREAAARQLRSLGVDLRFGAKVTSADATSVTLADGNVIDTHTLVWTAGVKASPLAEMLGVPLERGGRIPLEETLKVKGLDGVYAVGDIAYLIDPKTNQPHPQMIPPAIQQAKHASKNILAELKGQPLKPFVYFDKGIMATIGRRRAVAYPFNRVQLTGWFAWITWLMLHLIWLLGFRNRIQVFINWVWNYLTYDRGVRILLLRTTPADRISNAETLTE
jgi:NADH dehydrogenase